MDDELSLEEELLQVAGRSRPVSKKRRRASSDSDEEGEVQEGSGQFGDDPASGSKSRKRSSTGDEDDVRLRLGVRMCDWNTFGEGGNVDAE